MKRLSTVAALLTALALVGAPAYADNNNGQDDGQGFAFTTGTTGQQFGLQLGVGQTQGRGHGREHGHGEQARFNARSLVTVTGTIAAVDTATSAVSVTVQTLPQRVATFRQLKGTVLAFSTDTATQVRRNNATATVGSLAVGDHVSIRARVSLTTVNGAQTLAWYATRINANAVSPTPAPTPAPAPANLNFGLDGVIVGNNGVNTLTISTLSAHLGDGLPIKGNAVQGTTFTVTTDTATVITRGTATLTFAQLLALPFPPVSVHGTCSATLPLVCTAQRIDVVVPTA